MFVFDEEEEACMTHQTIIDATGESITDEIAKHRARGEECAKLYVTHTISPTGVVHLIAALSYVEDRSHT